MAADQRLIESGLSRQLVIALACTLAACSFTQDAGEAGGAVAPLMMVACATVLTAQHSIVTHASCGDRVKRAEGGWVCRDEGVR